MKIDELLHWTVAGFSSEYNLLLHEFHDKGLLTVANDTIQYDCGGMFT